MVGLGIVLLAFLVFRLIVAVWPSPQLGLSEGQLRRCPSKPNCVSSVTAEGQLQPIPINDDGQRQLAKLADILRNRPRTKVIKETESYLHAVERSLIFGYPDDIEFHLDRTNGQIHWRSASRIGYSDLGVNRLRIQSILKELHE